MISRGGSFRIWCLVGVSPISGAVGQMRNRESDLKVIMGNTTRNIVYNLKVE